MSDLPDDIKSALTAALAPITTRIEALETKTITAEHAVTQNLVKDVQGKIDALHERAAADLSWLKTDVAGIADQITAAMTKFETHVTDTVDGALHSPAGVALGAGIAFILGIAALALAQHLGIVG